MLDEQTFNAVAFVSISVALGVIVLISVWIARQRRPSLMTACGFLAGLAVFTYCAFWVAGMLELPCAYFFTVLRIPSATSAKGVRVSKIFNEKGARWVTDDYFCDLCGDHDNLLALRLETSSNRFDYYFAYDSRTRVLVPMTDAAAQKFPEFMPDGDELVSVETLNGRTNFGRYMGNNQLKLPVKWFQASVRAEKGSQH